MAHQWDRGVLNASSWHGLETIAEMPDAAALLAHGYDSGAWPLLLTREPLSTSTGLAAKVEAIVASYRQHASRVVGAVGPRYRATAVAEWASLCNAAVLAGARPSGAFSLRDGSVALATFEVGVSNGIQNHLVLADSFDGSRKLTCGTTSIRTVCANTLGWAEAQDGRGWANLRHTACLEEKVKRLTEGVGEAIATGEKVRDTYRRACQARLSSVTAQAAFDRLFPPAPSDSDQRGKTRAENTRDDARAAMGFRENHEGPNLATLWNAATWLVDRTVSGEAKKCRGGADRLDSLLFGSRAERVAEVQALVEIMMADGTCQTMAVSDAISIGASPSQIGRDLLASMLE